RLSKRRRVVFPFLHTGAVARSRRSAARTAERGRAGSSWSRRRTTSLAPFASSRASRRRSRRSTVAKMPSDSAKNDFVGRSLRLLIRTGCGLEPPHRPRRPQHNVYADARDALIIAAVGKLAAVVARSA